MTNSPQKKQQPKKNWNIGNFIVLTLAAGFLISLLNQPSNSTTNSQRFEVTAAQTMEQTFVKIIAETEQSVVSIARVERNNAQPVPQPNHFFPRAIPNHNSPENPDFIPQEFGSGIIIAPFENRTDQFILTNYHVVKGGPIDKKNAPQSSYRIYVRLANRRGYYAKIIAADPRTDLAILTIDYKTLKMKSNQLKPLKFQKKPQFQKGQMVLALGNPYAIARDGSASVSWGLISNISRRPKPVGNTEKLTTRKKETIHHFGTLLQVDTRLNLGTSGGALVNLKGELIGITTALAALDGYEKSVGYAIPFDDGMQRAVRTLARGQEVEYGFLGIAPENITPQQAQRLPTNFPQQFAVMAANVHRNTPADRAGIQPGDIILSINNRPVRNRNELMRQIGQLAPGTTPKIRVWRDLRRQQFTCQPQLGKWPVVNSEEIIVTQPRYPEWRGITVDFPTGRFQYLQRPYRYQQAVLLTQLRNPALIGQPGFSPGVFISHVNGVTTKTPAEFHAAVKKINGTATLQLTNGKKIPVTVPKNR